VDLYAAVSERHMQDALIGPTFGCIIAYQFQNWKWGDRFFYTGGGQPHSFTIGKKRELINLISWDFYPPQILRLTN